VQTSEQKNSAILRSIDQSPKVAIAEKNISHITVADDYIILISIIAVVIAIALIIFMHNKIVKLLNFIVSIPLYKRITVFLIGGSSTIFTSRVEPAYYFIPLVLGYIITFAFNEFSLKKDLEKATEPLKKEIKDKEKSIEAFRKIIEEKKNTFQSLILTKIHICLRVKGRDDSDSLRKTQKKIGDLYDIILAEKTFMETPDEALRRFDNSTSGNPDLASQTMIDPEEQ